MNESDECSAHNKLVDLAAKDESSRGDLTSTSTASCVEDAGPCALVRAWFKKGVDLLSRDEGMLNS